MQVNVSRCSAHGLQKDGKAEGGCPLIVMSSGRSLPNPDHPGTAWVSVVLISPICLNILYHEIMQ